MVTSEGVAEDYEAGNDAGRLDSLKGVERGRAIGCGGEPVAGVIIRVKTTE
jgi:hypothetical protein